MHIAIDFDDTIHDLSVLIARAISEKVGYEVLPTAVTSGDWPTYFQVDPEEILIRCEELAPQPKLMPGAEGFLRELLFCNHRVTIVTARQNERRLEQARNTIHTLFPSVAVEYSSTEGRAQFCKELGVDTLIDDKTLTCYNTSKLGINVIVCGERDAAVRDLLMRNQLIPHSWTNECVIAPTFTGVRTALKEFGAILLPPCIGLMGKARAGKDAASLAIRQLGFGYQPFSFAADLKSLARLLLDRDQRRQYCLAHTTAEHFLVFNDLMELYGKATEQDLVEKSPLGRRILQFLGKEVVRDCVSPEWWIRHLEGRTACTFGEHEPQDGQRVTISDVRYLNEAQFCAGREGLLIHVRRKGAGLQGDIAQHSSESLEALNVQYPVTTIDNDGTVEELKEKVRQLLTCWVTDPDVFTRVNHQICCDPK